MTSIGGYFELECGKAPLYYPDGIYLNLCRSGIRYLIRALGIKSLYVPYYTCDVVFKAIEQEGCIIKKYHINSKMMPAQEFRKTDFIIYNNYFGVQGENVRILSSQYPNLIVDNAQAFFSEANCRASIYSPRKFFGLPDGGILKGKDIPTIDINIGNSYSLCSHLLKRIDLGAQGGYHDFVHNDKALEQLPLERMSNLTKALMGNIDYKQVRQKRLNNFRLIKEHLSTDFPISMSYDDVPLVFPLYIEDGPHLRKKLIEKNIYCATYWPNIIKEMSEYSFEYKLAQNTLTLPIDQRYSEEDMMRIISTIKSLS